MTIHDEAEKMAQWTDKIGIKSASQMIRALSARLRKFEARPAVDLRPVRDALEWYANPEIYKPHPHGPAFDRRDLSHTARAALALIDGEQK